MSQSKWEIQFDFVGTGKTLKGEIMRLQAPLTVQTLLDKAPFTVRSRGNIGFPKNYWMFFVEIKKGMEKKQYSEFEQGDILYCPKQDALFVIYGKDAPKITLPVYFLGKITEGLDRIVGTPNGTMVEISFSDIS